ncbi:MAG: glycosyltransferase, partial [Methanobrevibacter millerae]
MYKISIIIPVFNTDNVLERTIKSIINQSMDFKDIELILVNDGSTDKSGEIMDNFSLKYENIKAIHLNKNCGSPGKPRNIGIKSSNAEYVMFLDSDDEYDKYACEFLYNTIIDDDADVVGGMMSLKNKNGEYYVPISSWVPIIDKTTDNYPTRKKRVEKKLLSNELYKLKFNSVKDNPKLITDFGFTTKIFRKSYLIKNSIFFPENLNGGEDAVFLFNSLINAKGIIFINKIIYYYDTQRDDKNNHSLTHNTSLKTIESRPKSYKLMYEIAKSHNQKEMFIRELLYSKLMYWFNNHLFNASNLTNDEILNILKNNKILFEECINYNAGLTEFFTNLFKDIKNLNFDAALRKINDKRTKFSKYLVSIIIPIKNNKIYIFDILDYFFNLNLNFEDIEIIFVDDGLQQDTINIIENIAIKYDNIKFIITRDNLNFENLMNLAILNSTTKYLIFLDENKFILENIDILYEKIKGSDLDIVSLKSTKFHKNNIEKSDSIFTNPLELDAYIFNKEFILKNNIQFESNQDSLNSFISKCFNSYKKHETIFSNSKISHFNDVEYNSENDEKSFNINNILDNIISIDFNEIEEFNFPRDTVFELHVNYKNIIYSFIINFSSKNKNLICFGPGAHARNSKNSKGEIIKPPYYDRWSWYKYFDESFIAYADPIFLYDQKITLGWFVGDKNQWYLESLSLIIKKLSKSQKILHENILFFGSSGGGFASLGLGTLIKGSKVLLNNSQFFIMNYHEYHIENLMRILESSFNESSSEIIKRINYRLNIIELFKKEKYIPEITYYLNLESKHDFQYQYSPFVEELSKLDLYNNQFNVKFYRELKDNPHEPLETKETLNIIKLFCKQNLFNELLNDEVIDVHNMENSHNKKLIIEKSKFECNKEYIIILENKLTDYHKQLLNNQSDVVSLKEELSSSQSDVVSLKEELSSSQSDVVSLKEELSSSQSDVV